jgi:hypothetical protein
VSILLLFVPFYSVLLGFAPATPVLHRCTGLIFLRRVAKP